jgi:hypothetical protein
MTKKGTSFDEGRAVGEIGSTSVGKAGSNLSNALSAGYHRACHVSKQGMREIQNKVMWDGFE